MAPSSVQCVWRRQQSRSLKKWANLHPSTISYSTTKEPSSYTLYQHPEDKIGTCTTNLSVLLLSMDPLYFMWSSLEVSTWCIHVHVAQWNASFKAKEVKFSIVVLVEVFVCMIMDMCVCVGGGGGMLISGNDTCTLLWLLTQCRHLSNTAPGSPKRMYKSLAASSKPQAIKPAAVLPKRNLAAKYYGPVFWVYITAIVSIPIKCPHSILCLSLSQL